METGEALFGSKCFSKGRRLGYTSDCSDQTFSFASEQKRVVDVKKGTVLQRGEARVPKVTMRWRWSCDDMVCFEGELPAERRKRIAARHFAYFIAFKSVPLRWATGGEKCEGRLMTSSVLRRRKGPGPRCNLRSSNTGPEGCCTSS